MGGYALLTSIVRQTLRHCSHPLVIKAETIDDRFLLDQAKADLLAKVIGRHWPEQIDPGDLGSQSLTETVRRARAALLEALGLSELA